MMKHYWAYAEVPNDYGNEIKFTIALKNGCRFKLNECYFTIYKEMFEKYPDSDYFRIDLVTEKDKKCAENIMRRAIDILVYITNVPFELNCLKEDMDINIQSIDISMSKRKIERLEAIDIQYGKIEKKKELLENVLRLYSLAIKYMNLFDDYEEAYFAMFRLIEKIAKDEFGIEHGKIDNGYNDIRSMIAKIIDNIYGIKIPSSKLDNFAGSLSAELMNTVFSDIYAKIAWFCEKKNISYDEKVLAKAVKQRNKLAHGDNININDNSDEYKLIVRLSDKFIYEKFFDNIKHCYLEARVIV